MTQRAGRIACPKCGSNNFDTVTVCWKCGSPLSQSGPAFAGTAMQSPVQAPAYSSPAPVPTIQERFAAPAAQIAAGAQVFAGNAFVSTGNPSTANRAAFWLGILMPYFGFPIGLAFMMSDDRRHQEVGRICLLWSTISGIVHGLFMIVTLLGMRHWFEVFLGVAKSQIQRGASGLGGGLGGGLD